MKLNLIQFIALGFVFGWVCGQVAKQPYEICMFLGLLSAFIAAYLNNAHGVVWNKVTRKK